MKKDQEHVAFAQNLRHEQTDAERAVWNRLRNRQLEGMKFRRQQPIGPYTIDFINYETNLIVEIDGGQHSQEGIDDARTRWLEERGYRVLRFWNNEVTGNMDGVLESIKEALARSSPSP